MYELTVNLMITALVFVPIVIIEWMIRQSVRKRTGDRFGFDLIEGTVFMQKYLLVNNIRPWDRRQLRRAWYPDLKNPSKEELLLAQRASKRYRVISLAIMFPVIVAAVLILDRIINVVNERI